MRLGEVARLASSAKPGSRLERDGVYVAVSRGARLPAKHATEDVIRAALHILPCSELYARPVTIYIYAPRGKELTPPGRPAWRSRALDWIESSCSDIELEPGSWVADCEKMTKPSCGDLFACVAAYGRGGEVVICVVAV